MQGKKIDYFSFLRYHFQPPREILLLGNLSSVSTKLCFIHFDWGFSWFGKKILLRTTNVQSNSTLSSVATLYKYYIWVLYLFVKLYPFVFYSKWNSAIYLLIFAMLCWSGRNTNTTISKNFAKLLATFNNLVLILI